jgi:putative transcriptional regulator
MVEMKLHIRLAEKRMTKKELSELTGVRLPTISAYCNNGYKHIVAEHINKFMEVLDLKNINELMEYIPDNKEN